MGVKSVLPIWELSIPALNHRSLEQLPPRAFDLVVA
jgi:hypothetical protein